MRKVIFDLPSPELKKLLVRKMIDIKAKGSYGRTELMFAIMNNNTELAKILIDEGSDVNARDDDGQTPLMYTTEYNDPVIAKSLIAAGADVNAQDNYGRTPLMYAVIRSNNKTIDIQTEIAKLLIDAGADVYTKNKDGETIFDFNIYEELKELYAPAIMKRLELKKQKKFYNEVLSDPVFQFKLSETKKRLKSRPVVKGVSGVVIADKIADMKNSGKIHGNISPTLGKKLREKITKEMIQKTAQR